MRKIIPLLLLVALGVSGFIGLGGKGSTPIGGPPTFFVSSGSGSDSNPGTQALPWQTITHVNAQSYSVNSTISFKGGESFSGALVFTPSNVPSGNLTVNSYGTGQATISSGNSACYSATNLPSMTVNNIACVGSGATVNPTDGIHIENNTYAGVGGHIPGPTITNNTVSGYGASPISVSATNGGGFGLSALMSGFDGTTINGNTISNSCGNGQVGANYGAGISVGPAVTDFLNWGVFTNLTVENNTVTTCQASSLHPGAQGAGFGMNLVFTTTVLVQNNLVHDNGGATTGGIVIQQDRNATVQFNEVYNQTNCDPSLLCEDGYGIDLDSGTQNSLVQYNYVHDNTFGNINLCDCNGSLTDSNTIRFNISGGGVNTAGLNISVFNTGVTNTVIYNNTFTKNSCITGGGGSGPITLTVANNICGDTVNGSVLNIDARSAGSSLTLVGNDYPGGPSGSDLAINGTAYGSLAALQAAGYEKVSGSPVGTDANPNLTGPIPGGNCGGYNGTCPTNFDLTTSSPAGKGNGLNLNTLFGYNVGTTDFYGNTISATTLPIGAAGNM